MIDRFMTDIVAVGTAIIGLAVIAVLVGQKAQTAGVITAATGGLASDIKAAVAPVS
jgi:PRD1 phage membrane DNA delivery